MNCVMWNTVMQNVVLGVSSGLRCSYTTCGMMQNVVLSCDTEWCDVDRDVWCAIWCVYAQRDGRGMW